MHRLAWAVDGTVSEQSCLLHSAVVLVVAEAGVSVEGRTGLVNLGVGIDLCRPLLFILVDGLALIVGFHGSDELVAAPVDVASQFDGSPFQGLTLGGIDHHTAHVVVGQLLNHGPYTADVEQFPRNRS